jgi:putative methanogen marker protein 4
MTLLDIFKSKARSKSITIGVGLGDIEEHNIKIFEASIKFLKEYDSKILLFGNQQTINTIKKNRNYNRNLKRIDLIANEEPEMEIISFLNENIINAIVRGCLSSNKFLKNIKSHLHITEINRLALLETYDGFQFFFGPVGIDECNSKESKINFLIQAIDLLTFLGKEPKISILSGGRLSDIGREPLIDKTIHDSEEIVNFFKNKYANLTINHDEILIENAVEKKSNIIIAPDGISGNLIYRTLVHLGGGKAYGAIYMGLNKIIIDTSRVGKISEIQGALLLALALSS